MPTTATTREPFLAAAPASSTHVQQPSEPRLSVRPVHKALDVHSLAGRKPTYVALLLSRGAQPDAPSRSGLDALILASRRGYVRVIDTLLPPATEPSSSMAGASEVWEDRRTLVQLSVGHDVPSAPHWAERRGLSGSAACSSP